MSATTRKHVLAVASGGGHWVQMQRVAASFAGHRITWVTTLPGYREQVPTDDGFRVVHDANLQRKLGLVLLALQTFWTILVTRPDVVISTGAAPGYFALRFGKWFGAKTIWVDSIANVERLSVSGAKVRRFADLWLTQWPHLADDDGPEFAGAVL